VGVCGNGALTIMVLSEARRFLLVPNRWDGMSGCEGYARITAGSTLDRARATAS
jgi:hypothetical protein